LNISASLKPITQQKGGRAWLTVMRQSLVLLSTIIRVIHPKLFDMGMQGMRLMGSDLNLADVLKLWYSIFNEAQVISN
jgi:hypothetical protein